MNNHSSSRFRAQCLALVLGLACSPALPAQSLPFNGRWLLDEPQETQATYTLLTVKDATMTWSGPNKSAPKCVQEFVLKSERPGTVYVDGRGARFISGSPGSLPTYLLKLSASSCGGVGEDVRIRYPLVYDVRHIEVIEYVSGKPVSSRRFHRKK